MSATVKKKLQHDVLFSCLDVLSRANATVSGSDPKLASDISDAIESLSYALQVADYPEQKQKTNIEDPHVKDMHEPMDINRVVSNNKVRGGVVKPPKKDGVSVVDQDEDVIVDVLTNEVVYKPPNSG